jgi:hypothetical protein
MIQDVTIFEGPDGAGKSHAMHAYRDFLFRKFRDDPPPAVIHHGPYPKKEEIATTYFGSMLPAFLGRRRVLLDRCWLSEPIYGAIYRSGENRVTVSQRRILERLALGCNAVIVLCLPDEKTVIENWSARNAKGKEYLPSAALVTEVYLAYSLLFLDPTVPMCLTKTELPIVAYDYRGTTIEELHQKIELARIGANRGPGVGAWDRRSVLLVGDRPNIPHGVASRWKFPFGGMRETGCSGWLARQLEEASIGERSLYWINAYDGNGRAENADFVAALSPRKVVALGLQASTWCAENSLEAMTTYHPQYWKRFRHGEAYPLLEEIKQ